MYQEYNGNDHRRYQRDPRETRYAEYHEANVHFREPIGRDAYSSSSEDEDDSYEEPPWVGQVNEKGDLFYIEPLREPSPPPINGIDNLQISGNAGKDKQAKDKDVFKKLNNVKKILPNLKRDKNNEKKTDEKNVKNNLVVDGHDMSKKHYHHHDNHSSSRTSLKKDIHLIVSPPKLGSGRHQDLETLLGIIPGRDKTGRLSQNDSYSGSRIYIKGFVPDGPALKCGELKIGDIILSLNKLDLNSSNVHTILAAITGPMEIILTIQRTQHPPKPVVLPAPVNKDDSHLIKLISGPPSGSSNTRTDLRDQPHAVFYLSMTSSEDDEPNKDILYQNPASDEATQLLALRGVFLTLSDLLVSVTGTTPQSSTVMVKKELVNVGYHKTGKQQVMIICLPSDKVSLVQLHQLVSDITKVLQVVFGTVDRAFCGRGNRQRLDHFFSLLFESILGRSSGSSSKGKTTLSNYSFLECLPGVQCLNLPTTSMVNINCCLSDLEAADYGELVDELFQIRRLYTILGSCIFYKGMLLANHLISEDFQDILLYCKYYCLLDVGQKQKIGQLVVWKEIFLTRRHNKRDNRTEYREPSGRHFVLIVGQKHMLLCVVLEAGGVARKAEGFPGPDSYYVEQLKNTLMQIETMDISSVCEASLRSAPNPPIISADLVLSNSATVSTSERNSSFNLANPATPPQGRRYGSLDSLKLPGDELDSSDSGSLPFKRRGSDSSGSQNSLSAKGKLRSYRSLSSLTCVGTLRKSFTESPFDLAQSNNSRLTFGKENTLFNYVTFDSFSGVLMCPTSTDNVSRSGSVHTEVMQNFYNTCLTIRKYFLPYYKQRLKSTSSKSRDKSNFSNPYQETTLERGVLFHRMPDTTEQKKTAPTLKYWVIGRLFPDEHPREFYVCYHSKIPQNMVEMAFKLGFGVAI